MKEFNTETKLSYGIDGDEIVRDADFETVRGMFEQNSFIKGVKEDSLQIEAKSKIAHEYIRGLI
jgi:hypothetical protein